MQLIDQHQTVFVEGLQMQSRIGGNLDGKGTIFAHVGISDYPLLLEVGTAQIASALISVHGHGNGLHDAHEFDFSPAPVRVEMIGIGFHMPIVVHAAINIGVEEHTGFLVPGDGGGNVPVVFEGRR